MHYYGYYVTMFANVTCFTGHEDAIADGRFDFER